MATINSITAATALDGADKILIETPLGPKSISGAVLKEQVTVDSVKKGRVILNEPILGEYERYIELIKGKKYDIYTNTAYDANGAINTFLSKTTIIYNEIGDMTVAVPLYQSEEDQFVFASIQYLDSENDNYMLTSNGTNIRIYKIIEHDEV